MADTICAEHLPKVVMRNFGKNLARNLRCLDTGVNGTENLNKNCRKTNKSYEIQEICWLKNSGPPVQANSRRGGDTPLPIISAARSANDERRNSARSFSPAR